MQTATISKFIIRFWSKFHIYILGYSFTRENRFLLNSSQSLQGKQENPCPSASRHVNNSLSKYFFLDSEINNKGMKVQIKRAFKSYFLLPKNNERTDRLCIRFSSTLNTSVLRFLYPPGQVLLITTIVLDLSRIFLEFFLKPVYPSIPKKFQIHVVNITGKWIYELNWICLLMLPSKTLPQVFIITTPREGNYPFLPNKVFWKSIFPQQRGRGLWSWKYDQN